MRNNLRRHWLFSLFGRGNRLVDVSLSEVPETHKKAAVFPMFRFRHGGALNDATNLSGLL
jgi:hypothetical protein